MKEFLSRTEVVIAIVAAVGAIAFSTLDFYGAFDRNDLTAKSLNGDDPEWVHTPTVPANASDRIGEIEDYLATGADINAPLPGQDWTLLITAASIDAIEVVAFLLECGADPNVPADKGVTVSSPLGIAIERRDAQIVEMLLEHGAKTDFVYGRKGEWNDAALEAAVETNRIELVEILLKYDADVNLCPPHVAQTPLLRASDFSRVSVEIIELLLENGADPNIGGRSAPRLLPLAAAVRKQDLSTMKLLVEHGADVNLSFAIHVAVRWATDDVVEYLVQVPEADVNHKPYGLLAPLQGNAPLHLVAMNGRLKAARLLLKRGADPNLVNGDGQTPLDIAKQKGHAELVKELEDASPDS